MSRIATQVQQMMLAYGQHVASEPALPDSIAVRSLRMRLLNEEHQEYIDAESHDDLTEVADALADQVVIIYGTALAYGIPLDDVLDEVMRSNLSKIVDGEVIRRDDGKVLKPEGWTPPDIAGVLEAAGGAK